MQNVIVGHRLQFKDRNLHVWINFFYISYRKQRFILQSSSASVALMQNGLISTLSLQVNDNDSSKQHVEKYYFLVLIHFLLFWRVFESW